ncbi:MAG: hypothetical protein D6E12_17370 [Desulfovibrio sp.]|nr:MAG: hypothetical protein D6E12_17370 [Desulfovibrio sp.]
MIHVTLEAQAEQIELENVKSVVALLNKLKRKPARCLVIREQEGGDQLLTPDAQLRYGDRIRIRDVSSRG